MTMRVKICGLRSVESALAAAAAGADLLGFNFAPVSKRRIEPAVAREAVEAVRANHVRPFHSVERGRNAGGPLAGGAGGRASGGGEVRCAGVFVNQPLDEVAALAAAAQLDYVQLSGDEDPAYCRALYAATGLPIIKAVRLGREGEASRAESLRRSGAVSVLLADTAAGDTWGGSGQPWRWQDAAGLAAEFPVLLAGGLTPENVAGAIAGVRPWGVDVASGVETNGNTDPIRVRAFIKRVRDHDHDDHVS
jgi:phosphoribosylanthranilate isomerase